MAGGWITSKLRGVILINSIPGIVNGGIAMNEAEDTKRKGEKNVLGEIGE